MIHKHRITGNRINGRGPRIDNWSSYPKHILRLSPLSVTVSNFIWLHIICFRSYSAHIQFCLRTRFSCWEIDVLTMTVFFLIYFCPVSTSVRRIELRLFESRRWDQRYCHKEYRRRTFEEYSVKTVALTENESRDYDPNYLKDLIYLNLVWFPIGKLWHINLLGFLFLSNFLKEFL